MKNRLTSVFGAFTLIIAILAIIFAFPLIDHSKISTDSWIGVIGVSLSALAFCIGTYMVWAAFDIYKIQQDVRKMNQELQKVAQNMGSSFLAMSDVHIYTLMSIKELGQYSKKSNIQNVIDNLLHERAKLFSNKNIELTKRLSLLSSLQQYGDKDDISLLNEVINDRTEEVEIRKQALAVKAFLIEKLDGELKMKRSFWQRLKEAFRVLMSK